MPQVWASLRGAHEVESAGYPLRAGGIARFIGRRALLELAPGEKRMLIFSGRDVLPHVTAFPVSWEVANMKGWV